VVNCNLTIMKSTIFFYALIFLPIGFLNAQNYDIGITFNPGASKITNAGQADFEGFPIIESKWTFSGNAGFFLNKPIGKKSSIGIELLYMVMENKDVFNEELFTFDPFTLDKIILGKIEDIIHTHLTYGAIPIFYKLKMERLYLKLGWQTMFLSKSNSDSQTTLTFDGETSTTKMKEDIKGLTKLDFGPKAGLEFQLSERAALSLQYYHGLKNMLGEDSSYNRYNRQATLGIQYSLTKNNIQ
jgi:Outer membrane protein beta-barrel domain